MRNLHWVVLLEAMDVLYTLICVLMLHAEHDCRIYDGIYLHQAHEYMCNKIKIWKVNEYKVGPHSCCCVCATNFIKWTVIP